MVPKEFCMSEIPLSEIAKRYGLELVGNDRKILTFGALNSRSELDENLLTYAIEENFISEFQESRFFACIIPNTLRHLINNAPEKSYLIASEEIKSLFHLIFYDSVQEKRWNNLKGTKGANNTISPSAIIHENVSMGSNCTIMDNVVILPNTMIGNNVTIKPNTTIGGDGFEVKIINGKRTLLPHVGGVYIGDDVNIGSSNCIDKDLFGSWTIVHSGSMTDNLVHIAHGNVIGRNCSITAGCIFSGSVTLSNDVWMAPNSSIINGVSIGSNSFIGLGSVVTKSFEENTLIYGVPAKAKGKASKK